LASGVHQASDSEVYVIRKIGDIAVLGTVAILFEIAVAVLGQIKRS